MTVGARGVVAALHQLAADHTIPALSAAGIKGVKRFELGSPGMSWPALYAEILPEGEGGPYDHQADSDMLIVDVCVAILATTDAKALQAAAALDVLRSVYSLHTGRGSTDVVLRKLQRRRGIGLSVRQFGGENGQFCHVARIRLTAELITPTEA